MILDALPKHFLYSAAHPGFAPAFQYLLSFRPGTPAGRYDIDGDNIFALVQDYLTAPAEQKQFEAHRVYIDLQYLVSGAEIIFHSSLDRLTATESYRGDKDVQMFLGAHQQPVCVGPGDFVILFPHDGHKPGCVQGEAQSVRKIVIKIRA